MNQMCKVCGEPAAGFHFGAFTCEGCKSFFGRTYNNLSSIADCKANGECIINKKNRTACKACRLRKCLLVGMSKSGSRYGRRSNWFKIHCLLQEQQQHQQHQHQHQHPQHQHHPHSQRKSTSASTIATTTASETTTTTAATTPSTTVDSVSAGSAASSSVDSANGMNGEMTSGGLTTVPALALLQQQYQQNYIKSTATNGSGALHRSTGTASVCNDSYPNHQTHPPTSAQHQHSNNHRHRALSTNYQHLHGTTYRHTLRYDQPHQQQHSPASDSGASSAGDPDESSSNHGRANDNDHDHDASMENFRVSVELKPRCVSSVALEKIPDSGQSPVPLLSPVTQPSRTESASSNHHLYEEFRARYGVFLNEYRNVATRHEHHYHHLDTNHRHLIAAASTLDVVGDANNDDEATTILQLQQNEPIDLSLGARKRKLSDAIEASPSAPESPAVASRAAVATFELQRPSPLDLTLLRSDALTG